jgi:hypothetical protein
VVTSISRPSRRSDDRPKASASRLCTNAVSQGALLSR